MRLLVILFLFSNYCGEGDPPTDSPVNTFDSVCTYVSKLEKHAFSQQVVLFPSFASFHKKIIMLLRHKAYIERSYVHCEIMLMWEIIWF